MTKKLVVSASLLAKSQVAAFTRKDGTMVQSHDNGRQAAAPKAPIAGASASGGSATAKTGSAAPEKKVNIGSEKWPLHARSSEKLPAKHADGSTHHVGGFETPGGGSGDHFLHHEGKAYSFTGKTGKNMKTGEKSFEFSHRDSEKGLEHRAWVTRTGHLQND